jgi:hypothetical protein
MEENGGEQRIIGGEWRRMEENGEPISEENRKQSPV